MLQDAHDLQRALQGPIVTADGSTGRLLYDNANRSEDDEEATLVVSFRLPVFLRGTAQVPALYLGPSQQHALNGGSQFYLVAQSDLACSGVLASSPAGCSHDTALDLGSGKPQVIECTCTTAGTYTFTLTGASGTTTCTVSVFAATVLDFTINPVISTEGLRIIGSLRRPMIFSRNPGLIEFTSSDESVATVTPNLAKAGTRAFRIKLKQGEYLARDGSDTAGRMDVSFLFEIEKEIFFAEKNSTTFGMMPVLMSIKSDAVNRENYRFLYSPYLTNFRWQYVESATAASIPSNRGTMFDINRVSLPSPFRFIAELTTSDLKVNVYHTDGVTPKASLNRLAETTGTMGPLETLIMMLGVKVTKVARLLTESERTAFITNRVLPSTQEYSFQGGHEVVIGNEYIYDTSGNNRHLGKTTVLNWSPASASEDFTDGPLDPVVQFQAFTITPVRNGTITVTAKRTRAGIPPDRPDAERFEIATATVQVVV